MDSVNLNVDVLHLILDHCSQNAVSQIMKTCRALNREGVQYLLSDIPVIWTKAQASSFVQFALTNRQSADTAHRLNWIDSLHILAWEEEAQAVAEALKPFFVHVAPRAPNFAILEIDYAEGFLVPDPELSASIASLTTLEVLALRHSGEQAVKTLRALQSRLTEAEIHFDLEVGPSISEDIDPLACIRRSEDTLRCISLRYTVFSSDAGCYRNVRALTLNFIDLPTTKHFVDAFPNLRCLRASECTAHWTEVNLDTGLRRKRDLNVAEQARHGSWSRLTSYKGSALMLYALGLACPVSHIYVHDDELEGVDPSKIRTILGDTRPLHLTVRTGALDYILAQPQDFLGLCRSVEFQRLPSLRLNFRVWLGGWNPPDPEEVMNLVYDAIAPSSVTAMVLMISFHGVITEPPVTEQRPGAPSRGPPPTSTRVRLFLDSMDPDAIADRLFTGNPLRGSVKVILNRDGKKRAIVHRGHPGLIVDLDFDGCF